MDLKNILNIHYDIDLEFGENKQKFRLIIDTGSSDLWIPSINCEEC